MKQRRGLRVTPMPNATLAAQALADLADKRADAAGHNFASFSPPIDKFGFLFPSLYISFKNGGWSKYHI